MAQRPNLPNSAAEDTVFDNLGLTREDLGLDGQGDDFGSGNEDLDGGDGSGNEDLTLDTRGQQDDGGDLDDDQGDRGQDRSRVTQTEKQKPAPFYHRSEVKPDKQGNLVNAEGIIVARKGREARLYQENHRFRGQAQTLQGQVGEVTGRLNKAVQIGQQLHRDLVAARSHNDAIKQFGIDATEQLTAMRLYKELRDNPQAAIKNILTRAAANGINIAELGATSGADPKSLIDLVRETIGKELNPLRERTQAEARQRQETEALTQRQNEIQTEVNSFFTENPEAQPYLQVFTDTIRQYPKMTLGEIWSRIQLHFAKNPQDQRRTQNSQRGRNGSRRSLPQGRSMPASNGRDDIAPVTDSYSTIVQAAMDAAGYTR